MSCLNMYIYIHINITAHNHHIQRHVVFSDLGMYISFALQRNSASYSLSQCVSVCVAWCCTVCLNISIYNVEIFANNCHIQRRVVFAVLDVHTSCAM